MSKLLPKTQRRHAAKAAALEPVVATLGAWIADWCRSVGGVSSQLGAARPFPYSLPTKFGAATVEAPQVVAALGIVEVVVRFDPRAPYPLPTLPGLRPRTHTWVYATTPGMDAETAFTAFLVHARQLFSWYCPACKRPQAVAADGTLVPHTVEVTRDWGSGIGPCYGIGQTPPATFAMWAACGRAPNATRAPATATAAVDVAPQSARGGVRTTVVDFHADGDRPAVKATVHAFRDDAGTPTVTVNGACAVHAAPWPTATYGADARQAVADILVMAGVKPDERFVYADLILARLDTVCSR
jgi:hypothetical protein